jgi:hypothetical protein
MSEHTRRLGAHEAVFRTVNEEIESLNRGIVQVSDLTMHVVCECGDLSCAQQLVVPVSEYERVRAKSTLFLVHPGHDQGEVEELLAQTEHYAVVRKRDADARRLAEETDPRSP